MVTVPLVPVRRVRHWARHLSMVVKGVQWPTEESTSSGAVASRSPVRS